MTITITHIDGPLKGEEETFDDGVDTILFGRDGELAQVVYPATYDVVGRRHFELRRTSAGDYTVELFGSRYVEVDGHPVDNGTPVKSGDIIRLGRKDGPAFKVEVGAVSATDTLPVTGVQSQMETAAERLRRHATYAGSALAVALVGVFGYNYYFLHSSLADQIESARTEAALAAQEQFSEATLKNLEQSVYLLAKKDGDHGIAEATAFAFSGNKLATNAHVTNVIKGSESEYYLVAPDGKTTIDIKSVVSHPGYKIFKNYKSNKGKNLWGNFVALDLINEYDVGIIEIDSDTTLPHHLELADQEDLEKLAAGTPVASFGFPVESLAGKQTATKAPGKLRFGHISALTDVFMVRAEPEHRLLIQHSVPVAGGASGSPLINSSGKVIGIVTGGNTTVFKDNTETIGGKLRVPNAALINFAQRVDLLDELAMDEADEELAADEAYWELRGEEFDDYFDLALESFKKDTKDRYGVSDGTEKTMEAVKLDPGDDKPMAVLSETFTIEAVPGHIYGFIADTISGVPLRINIKKQDTGDFVREAKDPRQTNEPEPAPTAWATVTEPTTLDVVVSGILREPAKFQLHMFEWAAPKPASTAGTAP